MVSIPKQMLVSIVTIRYLWNASQFSVQSTRPTTRCFNFTKSCNPKMKSKKITFFKPPRIKRKKEIENMAYQKKRVCEWR